MTNDQKIDCIIQSFANFNLRDITEINNCHKYEFTIALFTLCSCFIDQLSGFRYNDKNVGKRYRNFLKNYLPQYKTHDLYKDLRNKLVHNYSIGEYYGLTRKSPELHLQKLEGLIIINLENFIADLNIVLDKFSSELRTNIEIRRNALLWFSKYQVIGMSNI